MPNVELASNTAAAPQAKGLEEQARAASLETTAAVEAQSRETRRQFGETRAAAAQMGLLESVSISDLYSESATAAELDRLNREYEGEGRRRGLMFEAGVTRAARPLWGPAILRAGTNALTAYAGAGGKMPAGGGGTPKTGRSTMALNYRGGSGRGKA